MLIGISGGIGSGKSTVAKILLNMGYPVFDCDAEAARIMDSNPEIHRRLCAEIHPEAVSCGKLNRAVISEVVFNNPAALTALNTIVHKFVFDALDRWRALNEQAGNTLMFVESAILRSSGLIRKIDAEWQVRATDDERIRRVIARSGLSEAQIKARIKAQQAEESLPAAIPVHTIDNNPSSPLLPRIHQLLAN